MSGSVFAVNVLGGLAGSAHGVAVEFEAIGVVNQAIENGIGKGRFVDDVVPSRPDASMSWCRRWG
jgi:hypothetical protein